MIETRRRYWSFQPTVRSLQFVDGTVCKIVWYFYPTATLLEYVALFFWIEVLMTPRCQFGDVWGRSQSLLQRDIAGMDIG